MVEGKFIHMSAEKLATMRTTYENALEAVGTLGQSYSIANRVFTKANLKEISDILAEINYAIEYQKGSSSQFPTRTVAGFNC